MDKVFYNEGSAAVGMEPDWFEQRVDEELGRRLLSFRSLLV